MNIQGWCFFRIDCFDFIAVQRTPRGLLQSSWKELSSAFFLVQLSHPYMTTGKTIALTFVSKVIALLLNMLSMFVIAFLPRSKRLLISWPQSLSAVIFVAQEKVCHCFHFFSIYLPWSDGTECHDLHFLNVDFEASFLSLFHLHQGAL